MVFCTRNRVHPIICIAFATVAIQTHSLASQAPDSSSEDEHTAKLQFIPQIDQVFNSPLIQRSLDLGTDLINRELDSLMEAVFYSLLDNEFQQQINRHIVLRESLTRTLFTTGSGNYVVVERLHAGPEFFRTFTKVDKIPLSYAISGNADVLNIYLRSDAQRTIEELSLPSWRYWVNNWLGLVTIFERILPPSFNPSEIYDPIRQLETVITFPTDKESFESMAIGSIRSYAFQGGISLPFSLEKIRDTDFQKVFKEISPVIALPYTLFVQGEYRINVLKRSQEIAWVGVAKKKRYGHSLAGLAVNTFFILKDSIRPIPWGGIPADLRPIDASITDSILDTYDLVFSFDLSTEKGLKAYQQAIRGNFKFPDQATHKVGGSFQFERRSHSHASSTRSEKALVLLYSIGHSQTQKESATEVLLSNNRKYLALQSNFSHRNTEANILTGSSQVQLSGDLILHVIDREDKGGRKTIWNENYAFSKNIDPYELVLRFQINNRSATHSDYYNYIRLAEKLTLQKISDMPKIPHINQNVLARRRRMSLFFQPHSTPLDIHVTPNVVGNMNAVGLLVLYHRQLAKILDSPPDKLSSAFKQAFALSREGSSATFFDHLASGLVYPLRLADIKFPSVDAPVAVDRIVATLGKINTKSSPKELINAFSTVFDTAYPVETLVGLLKLVDSEQVPRKATFFVKPDKMLSDDLRHALHKANARTYRSGPKFPKPSPLREVEHRLAEFGPSAVDDIFRLPYRIDKLEFIYHRHLRVTVREKERRLSAVYVYLKLETAGELHLGEAVLAKQIVRVWPEQSSTTKPVSYLVDLSTIEFSPLDIIRKLNIFHSDIEPPKNGFENNARYIITVSVSEDKIHWSDALRLQFRVKDEQFVPYF